MCKWSPEATVLVPVPIFKIAELPKPNLALVSAPVVVTQAVPLATIKLFAVLSNTQILVKLADNG